MCDINLSTLSAQERADLAQSLELASNIDLATIQSELASQLSQSLSLPLATVALIRAQSLHKLDQQTYSLSQFTDWNQTDLQTLLAHYQLPTNNPVSLALQLRILYLTGQLDEYDHPVVQDYQFFNWFANQYQIKHFDDLSSPLTTSWLQSYHLPTDQIQSRTQLLKILANTSRLNDQERSIVTNKVFDQWSNLDDQTLMKTAFELSCIRDNNRSDVISKLFLGLRFEQPYPYEYLSYQPAETMFRNLVAYQPVYSNQRYRIKGYNHQQTSPSRLPPLLDGRPVSIKVGEDLIPVQDGLSSWFTEPVRLEAKLDFKPCSPMNFWKKNADWIHQQGKGQPDQMREVIWDQTRWATIFKPSWAKALLMAVLTQPNLQGLRWLDFSAGWGDRLLTAISLGIDYTGIDPNLNLKDGHDSIIKKFSGNARVIYQPFEDVQFNPQDLYDVVFTSPPFFNFEIYSDQPQQSVVRYQQFDTWFENFLKVSLNKAWNQLKSSGNMIIHISDSRKYSVIDPMLDYLDSLPGSTYRGVIGVAGQRGIYKPAWIYRKE